MILYINTIQPEAELKLFSDSKLIASESWFSGNNQSYELLSKIGRFLKSNKLDKQAIKGVAVNTAPGSYTGARVGVTTANLLAFSLDIPVYGIEGDFIKQDAKGNFQGIVLPRYRSEPFITKAKAGLKNAASDILKSVN